MATPQATAEHHAQQRRLTVATVAAARTAWRGMTPEFDASWQRVLRRLLVLISAGQLAAARAGAAYVPEVLEELGIDAPPVGEVAPQALAGTASDGRPLDSLLYTAVITAKRRVGEGHEPIQALEFGRLWMEITTRTQVADAARQATSVGMTARPRVRGYVRMLSPPSCSRCTLLAGRFYRWNEGFERHPSCDCRHIPADEDQAEKLTTDPRRYFDSLSQAEQDRVFTKAGAQAVRDGADISRVVNARRGMETATTPTGRRIARRDERGLLTTTEGVTRRGRRRGQTPGIRLMPESIYDLADGDREEALRLLRLHGYLI